VSHEKKWVLFLLFKYVSGGSVDPKRFTLNDSLPFGTLIIATNVIGHPLCSFLLSKLSLSKVFPQYVHTFSRHLLSTSLVHRDL
jgi:hypothetical protein